MRTFATKTNRLSALTARLSSPFLRPVDVAPVRSTSGPASREPQGNKAFSEAALRYCRTLW